MAAILGFLLPIILLSSNLHAGVISTYGLSASRIGQGNISVVGLGNKESFGAYPNPANLTNTKTGLAMTLIQVTPKLNDLPSSSAKSGSLLDATDFKASQAKSISGTLASVNLKISPHLFLGLVNYLPSGRLGSIVGHSPGEVNYLRFSERQQRPELYTAIAYRIGSWSIGLGMQYLIKADGYLDVALNNQSSESRMELDLYPSLSPYGGVSWSGKIGIFESLKFGISYRAAQSSTTTIDSRLVLGVSGKDASLTLPFDVSTRLVPYYEPESIRLGLSASRDFWNFAIEFEQQNWSQFEPPLVQLQGDDIVSLTNQSDDKQGFSLNDTRSIRIGLSRENYNEEFLDVMRFGFELHESVTEKKYTPGIVDPARRSLSIGAGKELELDNKKFLIDLALQHQWLDKIDSDGDRKNLNAGGKLLSIVAGVSYETD